jgi:predicted anti-sigma-YlaC factor YlaD
MLLLSCKKVSKVASASLDRKLSGYERSSFEAHLLICPPCRRNRKQMEVLEKMLRGSALQEGQGEMSQEGKDKTRKALEEKQRG